MPQPFRQTEPEAAKSPGPARRRTPVPVSSRPTGLHNDAGAKRRYRVRRWWVAKDVSGNPFCVIRPESKSFPDHANNWEGPVQYSCLLARMTWAGKSRAWLEMVE